MTDIFVVVHSVICGSVTQLCGHYFIGVVVRMKPEFGLVNSPEFY